jgi:hypothetical protein
MKIPTQFDSKTESADSVLFPRIIPIQQNVPLSEIMSIISELFGPETDHPENKPFMEEACDHWKVNNTDEMHDPALEIDFATERCENLNEWGE